MTEQTASTVLRDGVTPWPDDVADVYRSAGCWRDRPLGDLVWEWAEARPDQIAVIDGPTRFTYAELARRADRAAVMLRDRGLGRGSVVLVALPNGWELVVLLLGCLRAGVAPVMMLPAHRDHELAAIGRLTGAEAIAVPDTFRGHDHQAMAERVRELVPLLREVIVRGDDVREGSVDLRSAVAEPADDDQVHERRSLLDGTPPSASDVAVFLLSGGTTGLSKVIARTHNDYEYNARRSAEVCGFGPGTVYLAALPAGHNFPLASPGILGTLMVGGTVALVPSPAPARVLGVIARERVTVVAAVPAVLSRWVAAAEGGDADLASLEIVQVGGSLFAPEAYRRAVDVLGCRVQQVYGMAEGLLCYVRETDPDDVAAVTQGRPISEHDELRIVDPDGAEVPPGEAGELLVRGPYTPRGYFRAPEQNAEAFADGWYRTGDLVTRHPSGNLVVVGRTKDVVNRGGEKVSADEVERLVQALDAVAEVAVIPAPDPDLGERVCVCVVPAGGRTVTLPDIRRELTAAGVAEYKIPEQLLVLDEMPQTSVGKTDKTALSRIVRSRLGRV
ncbi:AMP-binding protein [Antribacter sp. KLBMP9083]|uniref:AMP-binding protein n=1 Tax=Antribacter soli TaxID=2910976 RepID=A0AA41UB37_9MICO|nr:AMP-binding protein [Antribacter soli]MCF4123362.1 AMP-binding protein [Antribacter soli]